MSGKGRPRYQMAPEPRDSGDSPSAGGGALTAVFWLGFT